MPRTDLFQKAQNNTVNIDRLYDTIRNRPGAADFADCVQSEARVSINRKAPPLIGLLQGNEMVSGYRDYETKNFRNFEAYLIWRWSNVEGVRKYIRRRVAFLQTFVRGEEHLFGALNVGNAGAAAAKGAYGYYCLVLSEHCLYLGSIAYCKKDTLAADEYWTCDDKARRDTFCPCRKSLKDLCCRVDVEVLCENYAPHSHRGRLAALKHQDEITEGLNRVQIAEILINRNDGKGKRFSDDKTEEYIEACFVIPITRESIEEVRFHVGLAFRIIEEALIDIDNPGNHASFMHQHNEVLELLRRHGIEYRVDT